MLNRVEAQIWSLRSILTTSISILFSFNGYWSLLNRLIIRWTEFFFLRSILNVLIKKKLKIKRDKFCF